MVSCVSSKRLGSEGTETFSPTTFLRQFKKKNVFLSRHFDLRCHDIWIFFTFQDDGYLFSSVHRRHRWMWRRTSIRLQVITYKAVRENSAWNWFYIFSNSWAITGFSNTVRTLHCYPQLHRCKSDSYSCCKVLLAAADNAWSKRYGLCTLPTARVFVP